jgi:F-type H+-transporting ATPase subunit alpha
LQSFAQFGSDLDADTKARLDQGQRIVEVLKQGRNEPIAVELQIAIIYAVVNNLLKDIEIEDISRFEKELFEYLTATRDDLLAVIRETGVMTDETTEALRDSILVFKDKFLNKA